VWALHDRALNACVLYEDAFGPERAWEERTRTARHVLLHACQEAWYAGQGSAPHESWLLEGMADALARTGADPSVVRPDPLGLRMLAQDAQDERRSFAYLRTLEELLSVGEAARLPSFYRERTPKELEPLDTRDSWWPFYRQASSLFAYLWSDQDARHRPALVAFVGDALRGQEGVGKFQERFAGSSTGELERGWLAWLVREHQRAYPVEKLDAERVQRALVRGGGTPPAPPAPALDLADASAEERLALALFRLSEGKESAGSAALDVLAAEPLEATLHERVERERARLALWREQRDAYLRALVGSGTLAFSVDGKPFKAKVLGFQDGEVVLDKNRSGRERLTLDELDPLALAQEMPRGGASDWARLLPYVLRGDVRAKKLLKDDGGEGGALLRDSLEDYPARLRLGRTLARIEALGTMEDLATPAAVEARLTELRALRQEAGDQPVMQRKEPALLVRARALLERKYELLGDASLLSGKLEVLAGETIRLTYAFDDPRELEDFDPAPYPVLVAKGFPPLAVTSRPFGVENGELTACGQACLRSRFELAPPLTIRYGVSLTNATDADKVPRNLYLGVADDHAEHFVWGKHQTLQAIDEKRFDIVQDGTFRYYLDAVYAMQLRHDGERVFLTCENKEISIAAGGRKNGAIFLFAYSGIPVRIPELVIEGRLLPDSLKGLRLARIERELATF
jgi:hypothetical protein